jgi:LPXTG-motif cell wall-anchored protein
MHHGLLYQIYCLDGKRSARLQGQITFRDVTLPADWESGSHTLTVYDDATGDPVATVTFNVDVSGDAQPKLTTSGGVVPGDLPATGSSGNDLLKPALVVLLFGALLVLTARRKRTPRHLAYRRRQGFGRGERFRWMLRESLTD